MMLEDELDVDFADTFGSQDRYRLNYVSLTSSVKQAYKRKQERDFTKKTLRKWTK